MAERILPGSYWTNKLGDVVKITSVARTPDENWVSYSAFGDSKKSASTLEITFLQRFKPYKLHHVS